MQANSTDSCGRPLVHSYGDKHTTGEAKYIGDIKFDNMGYCGVVQSQRPHAKFTVDTTAALAVPGVIGWVDVNDVPKGGKHVSIQKYGFPDDTTMFAEGEVVTQGQIIGAIVADDVNTAHAAAQKVNVTYEDLPAIASLQAGIEAKNFLGPVNRSSRGDFEAALKASEFTLSGELGTGGQEHIYMETNSAVAVPEEGDEITVYSATQV